MTYFILKQTYDYLSKPVTNYILQSINSINYNYELLVIAIIVRKMV